MRYGLIGEKLGHSFSKLIHEQLCSYTYDLIELARDEVDAFMKKRDFAAINVTIPYKETVIPYLAYIDPAAKAIGAVNTIVNKNGLLYGYNTDFAGIEYMLARHGFTLAGKKVLILGSGGTCKTSSAVARHQGCRELHIVSRNPSNTFPSGEGARRADEAFPSGEGARRADEAVPSGEGARRADEAVPSGEGARRADEAFPRITYEQAYAEHADADLIFNTTPVGMFPNIESAPIDLSRFDSLSAVVDVIYNPAKTALLQQAEALHIPCCNGLEMLVAQAKYAAEHFLGAPLPDSAIADVHAALSADRQNIALIGMPSCGKSTIGRLLAQETGKRFVDVDDLIVKLAGKSIPEIFAEGGEAHFRAIETEALRSVAGKNGQILATGGGIIKNEVNIRLLRSNSRIYFIDRPLAQLVTSDPTRPLSSSAEAVKAMYDERLPLYRAYAHRIVDNSDSTPDSAVRCIKEDFYEAART